MDATDDDHELMPVHGAVRMATLEKDGVGAAVAWDWRWIFVLQALGADAVG
jgi:hypothetical protein